MNPIALVSGDQPATVTSTLDGAAQPYRLFVPEVAAGPPTALPLLVVLHGKGVDHHAWFKFTPVAKFAQRYGYVVAAPNGRGEQYYEGPGEQDVLDIIAELRRRLPIDADRIYLAGHSMGGWGTWHLGLRHPDLFAAICPLAGFPVMELLPNARYLSPFIIHDADDPVILVDRSRRPAARLAELGVSFQYREESGYGHASRMIGDNLPRVFEWFECHKRVTDPRRITYVVNPAEGGSAWWLRVPAAANAPAEGLAEVDARLESPESLTVAAHGLDAFALNTDALPVAAPPRATDAPRLRVVVNGCTMNVDRRAGWAVFRREGSDAEWSCTGAEQP